MKCNTDSLKSTIKIKQKKLKDQEGTILKKAIITGKNRETHKSKKLIPQRIQCIKFHYNCTIKMCNKV